MLKNYSTIKIYMMPFSCSQINCFNFPSITYTINGKQIYNCAEHSLKCRVSECNKQPKIHNKYGKKQLYYCVKHSKQYQTILCHKKHCNSVAVYNYINKCNPWYCIKHRTPSMEILTSHCIFIGCHKKATHNFAGRMKEVEHPKGLFCCNHKKRKMISVEEFNDGYSVKTIQIPIPIPAINTNTNDVITPNITPNVIPTISIIYDIRKKEKDYCLNEYDIMNIPVLNENNIETCVVDMNEYEIV